MYTLAAKSKAIKEMWGARGLPGTPGRTIQPPTQLNYIKDNQTSLGAYSLPFPGMYTFVALGLYLLSRKYFKRRK